MTVTAPSLTFRNDKEEKVFEIKKIILHGNWHVCSERINNRSD